MRLLHPLIQLIFQRAATVVDHHARDAHQQGAVFLRQLFAVTHENTARNIGLAGSRAGRHQPEDLIL
ncbi:hypothetical protein D3C80_1913140 [compost metagenome]